MACRRGTPREHAIPSAVQSAGSTPATLKPPVLRRRRRACCASAAGLSLRPESGRWLPGASSPWNAGRRSSLRFFFSRPEGGRSSLEYRVLIELNPMPAKQLKKLRLEVHGLMMLLLARDVGFDFRHVGSAHGKAAVALLP